TKNVDDGRTARLAAGAASAPQAAPATASAERTLRAARTAAPPLRLAATPQRRSWLPLATALVVVLVVGALALGMKHGRQADAAQHDTGRLQRDVMLQFRAADTNRDGYLSLEEMHLFPFLAKEFERIDIDGDGRISPAEFQRARSIQLERRVAKRAE